MKYFIGREEELKRLKQLLDKKTASFIVVKGRRRVGKSRLIQEFSKQFDHFYDFTGLAPEAGTTNAIQLGEFSRQMSREFKTANARYDDWSDVLWSVGERVQTGKTLVFFDEISWMGSKDPAFLGKIKNLWDLQLKKNDQLVFIICGSASAWIDENILSSTGFVGRISFTMTLDELPLIDCDKFWPKNIDIYEKLKVLVVTGGIPKYLEEINPRQSAEENIKRLCFTKGGLLVEEFAQLFSDLFLRKSNYYKQIIAALAHGSKEQGEICRVLDVAHHGRISEYLWELEEAGFIARDRTWKIKTGEDSELSKYRLQDNYLRFYLKYIEKNLSKISRNTYDLKSLSLLPEWAIILGLQFENLILNNRKKLHEILAIKADEIISENPFFQRKTQRARGCQIDYMIQTKFGCLYICEIKFSKNKIDATIIDEVQRKIDRLKRPKGYSCRPVLIHVNGVTDDVVESDFFVKIIDLGEFLKPRQ